ncbi:TPA: hypothetical protein ACS705_001262 [Providencia alcalifaciens]
MKVVFNVDGKKVPLKSLQYISKTNQLEVMRNWFFENFEDPVHSCPYNGGDGGYAYIYGGPYDAREELQAMFEGYVKLDLIEELVSELQEECYDWSANSNNIDDWYDDDLYSAVTSSEEPFVKFNENLNKIRLLAEEEHKDKQRDHLLGLLYTNIITALETLYVELFIHSLEEHDLYISNLIEKGKTEFKVSKEILALPFKGVSIENIKQELIRAVKEHLISASWHNTDKVVGRYKATFNIKTQKDWPITEIEAATLTRNHLVHRGGKDKEGNPVTISEKDLEQLLDHAMQIGTKLNNSLISALQEQSCITDWEF